MEVTVARCARPSASEAEFASFVLFAAVLSAQQAPSAKPGKVDGVVLNSVTNDPVKKAIVMLQALGAQ